MPSKYLIRESVQGGIYHVYNRGVDKRTVFLNDQDYNLFIYYLYIYLTPLETVLRKYKNLPLRLFSKNLSQEVELLAYCLMPNHFHLLLKQHTTDGVTKLMKQVSNAYTEYFNPKYERTGALFEGPYKALHVTDENVLIHLSRYVHLNPYVAGLTQEPDYKWSSYKDYANPTPETLSRTELILSFFPSIYSYKKFVHDQKSYAKQLDKIGHVLIKEG